jgi:hypothetical protein
MRPWIASSLTLLAMTMLLAVLPAIASAQDKPPFVTILPTPETYAWWLRLEYHPFGTDVRGIPVGKIRPGWCKANEFRKDLFPAEEAKEFEDTGLSFAVDGFFDGSKTKQTALVGVYETCKGEHGVFLLVLTQPQGRPLAIKFVQEIPGEREFAMVYADDASTVAVQHCLECDHFSKYKWNKARKRFVLLPPERDE